jgi:hypothetical protein
MREGDKGSSGHIRKWVKRDDFVDEVNEMVGNTGATVDAGSDRWMPTASDHTEARLEKKPGIDLLPSIVAADDLLQWWLAERGGANTPNWDLAASCTLGGKPGIILMEAKAHEGELDWGPKPLALTASAGSKANHRRIGEAIQQARDALDCTLDGTVSISRDRHYQLSNRIAFAWKLASMGVPVVLVYLGFTGDTYFKNDYLRDANHWQRVMGGYMQGLFPLSAVDVEIPCGKSSFTLMIKSRPVQPSR